MKHVIVCVAWGFPCHCCCIALIIHETKHRSHVPIAISMNNYGVVSKKAIKENE